MRTEPVASFLAVFDNGGYQLAAEATGGTASALHKDVRALERSLGVQLFIPVGRQVRPTGDAISLAPACRNLMAATAEVVNQAKQITYGSAGTVRVACATFHVGRFLAVAKYEFLQYRPDADVQLIPIPADIDYDPMGTINLVLRGEADLSVGREHHEGMDVLDLWEAKAIVLTADDHPFRHRSTVQVEEVLHEPLMVAGRNHGSRRFLELAAARAGVPLRITLEALPDGLRAAAAVGLGIAVFGDDALMPPPLEPYPALVDEHGSTMVNRISMRWVSNRVMSPITREFVDFVAANTDRINARTQTPSG